MRIWTINDFEGHWPVGTAAVVAAESREDAAKLLEDKLSEVGLTQEIRLDQLVQFSSQHRNVRILCDGDY